jgi:geranylgeranyl diphosphate synthase type II
MDNDDFRRGKPSCHKAFDEATALLAGDALLTEAFNIALATENLDSKRIIEAARVLAECSGINGMIGGQVIDLKYEDSTPPLNSVLDMYKLKTSALLVAAAKIGCIIGGADKTKINNAAQFAEKIGLAFQIMDDILDITSTSDVLGKPVGSDEQANKSTYVSLVGLENAKQDVEILTNQAITLLDCFGSSAEELKKFAVMLCKREK